MNTLHAPAQASGRATLRHDARVGLLDRAAMRVGLALLLWGRRRIRRAHDVDVAAGAARRRRLREHYEREAAHAAPTRSIRLF